MDRRRFLVAAGLGGMAGLRAQQAPVACVAAPKRERCPLPVVNPDPFPVHEAQGLERSKGDPVKRKLWSKMSPDDKTGVVRDLQKAYQSMVAYDATDPCSPVFQAWLHRYYCCNHDPAEKVIIPGVDRDVHHSSAFFPWHRAFLFFYERLIQRESGNLSFRLPVWDWDASKGNVVPLIYDQLPLPKMPCACDPREKGVPEFGMCLLTGWLQSNDFDSFVGTAGAPGIGANGPHSTVHTKLGGYMSNLETAAIDPVFFAHHANVDRFWWDWWEQSRKMGFVENWPDPSLPSSTYYFYDFLPQDKPPRLVGVTAHELMDIGALGYGYDPTGVKVAQSFRVLSTIPSPIGVRPFLRFGDVALGDLMHTVPQINLDAVSTALTKLAHNVWNGVPDIPGFNLPDIHLPVHITFKMPDSQPGKYYYIAVADANNANIVVVGGFGAFSPAHGGPSRFSSVSCLTSKKLALLWPLIRKSRRFRLVCALAQDKFLAEDIEHEVRFVNGKLQEVDPVVFEIQLPLA